MPFSMDAQLLELWESGLVQHPVDRALSLLIAAEPGETRSSLAALPVAELDRRLLKTYQDAFGGRLACLATCPVCGEQLEFSLEADRLSATSALPRDAVGGPFSFSQSGFTIQYRMPNSFDLAAAAADPEDTSARNRLFSTCILSARNGETVVDPGELPEEMIAALEASINENDPQAEWLLELVCAACQQRWEERLDVASFIWTQVATHARRLIIEVHSLASAYGWREADILAMSAPRRQAYLELAG